MNTKHSLFGTIGSIWGLIGVLLFVGYAIYRLSGTVFSITLAELEWYHWLVLIVNGLILLYLEGYRGFQRGLAPRVGARARHIRNHPHPLWVLFAPVFCMGYFHIIRRKQISTILLTIFIILIIIWMRTLPPPWRGVLDVGVLVALSWGIVQLVWYGVLGLTAVSYPHSTYIDE